MKKYILLAGVNGAGKTTLFSLIPSVQDVEKINLDETVRQIGDWRDYRTVIEAGKMIIKRIGSFFDQGISFSQETTLCGRSILRNIQKAKDLGYFIEMHYVGLDNPETAKARVKNRVKQGGHGIPDADIERRYLESLENFKMVLPQCDLAVIYDNTEVFRRFAIYQNGKTVWISNDIPEWYLDVGQ